MLMRILAAGLLILATQSAVASEQRVFAVLELNVKGKGVDANTAALFADAARAGALDALRDSGFRVLSRDTVELVMQQVGHCDLGECDAEIAGNLGASHFITGDVQKVGRKYFVTLKLSQTAQSTLLATEVIKGERVEDLVDSVQAATTRMVKSSLPVVKGAAPGVVEKEPNKPAISVPRAEIIQEQARSDPTPAQPAAATDNHARAITLELLFRPKSILSATKREERLRTLEQVINLGPPAEQLPDLMFQKAQLLDENAERCQLELESLGPSATGARTSELTAKRDQWLESAMKIEHEITRKHAGFIRMDEVLHALALDRARLGVVSGSLDAYRQLIQQHPESPYVAAAYAAFGDHHYDRQKWDNAAAAYKQTMSQDPAEKVHAYAAYKLGWTHYFRSDWQQAGNAFKEVILWSDLNQVIQSDAAARFRKEGKAGYVAVYARSGDPRGAASAMGSLAKGAELHAMLQELAGIYRAAGRAQDADIVLSQVQ